MFNVFFQGVRVYDDVVQVYIHPLADIAAEEVIHQCLVCCRRVAISDLDYGADHIAVRSGNRGPIHMLWDYSDLLISILTINYGSISTFRDTAKDVVDVWEWCG